MLQVRVMRAGIFARKFCFGCCCVIVSECLLYVNLYFIQLDIHIFIDSRSLCLELLSC